MSAYVLVGWDTSRLGAMAVHLSDGTDSGTATMTTNTYAHRDLSSVMGSGEYADLATQFNAQGDAVLVTNGLTISWSATTLKYTISGSGSFALDFTSGTLGDSSGKRLADALGFNYNHADATGGSASDPYNISLSGSTSYISNVIPAYAFALSKDGISDYVRPHEVKGQTKRVVSSAANAYSIGPETYEKRTRFRVRFQTLATVHASEADDTAAPWTYEDLREHARCWEPVLLSYTGETTDMVFKFVTGEFDDGNEPVWSNYHGRWTLPIEGQYLGRI